MLLHFTHRRIFHRPLTLAVILFGFLSATSFAEKPDPPTQPEALSPEPAEKSAKKPPALTAGDVDRLIGDLSSDDFATREAARKKLGEVTIASTLAESMRQRYLRVENPEVKLRLRRILHEVARIEFLGQKRAFLGIQMQDAVMVGGITGREMLPSIQVLSVIPESAAEEHGVNYGDHILSVNGKGFEAAPTEEFKRMIGTLAPGDTIKLKLRRARGGIVSEKAVVLGEMPDSRAAFEPYFLLWLEKGGEIKRP